MKLFLHCMHCNPADILTHINFQEVEFNNDGYYQFTCPQGHKNYFLLQNLRFEILFEIGIFAINDGYYREAVASFTAALENFYTYCIRIFSLRNKVPQEQFTDTWKIISRQSERQFGAFCFLYLANIGELPIKASEDDKIRQFRNKVIHQGYIPNKEEALKYGEVIFDFINQIIIILSEHFKDEMQEFIFEYLQTISDKIKEKNIPFATMLIGTLISTTVADTHRYDKILFKDAMQTHLEYKKKEEECYNDLSKIKGNLQTLDIS
ncbi:MAG: hypothetical protein NC390_02350 [Fusobacterium sp.]|nr:hypothetical protein [Fusobacterium sp.]